MQPETRRLQQVGHSTLIVSLPRKWIKDLSLQKGDTVSLQEEDDGSLKVLPANRPTQYEPVKSVINADKCSSDGLLARIITGAYLLGHESIRVESRRGLSKAQLAEVRSATRRLTGLSVVEQTLNHAVLQNFIDPLRFPVKGLIRRLYIITSSMLDASHQILKEGKAGLVEEVVHMEVEANKIYWLIVRQLLLAAGDRRVGKVLEIESPLHVVGNRVVSKALENLGDSCEDIAKEGQKLTELEAGVAAELQEMTDGLFEEAKTVYKDVIKAFFELDAYLATNCISRIGDAEKKIDTIFKKIFSHLRSNKGDSAEENVQAYIHLTSIIWHLGRISDLCNTIAEITINRFMEKPNELCSYAFHPGALPVTE